MAGVNKVILVGNLGADPEVRMTNSGMPIASLRIATAERIKGKDGTWTEKTEWHRVKAFGRTAEICQQYLTKGRQIYVEGRLETSKWTDKQGQERYTTEIICNTMQMLGSGGGGGGGARQGGGMSAGMAGGGGGFEDDMAMANGPASSDEMGGGFPSDDDIPF